MPSPSLVELGCFASLFCRYELSMVFFSFPYVLDIFAPLVAFSSNQICQYSLDDRYYTPSRLSVVYLLISIRRSAWCSQEVYQEFLLFI
jgi:hypothetical protein